MSVFRFSFLSGVFVPYILSVGIMDYFTTVKPTAVRSAERPEIFMAMNMKILVF
jgi:hypothetical protein